MPTVDADLPNAASPEDFSAQVFGVAEPWADGAAGLELAPFRGVRFVPAVVGDLARVTSPPYDLIDREQVRRLRAEAARNVVRLILPEDYAEAAGTLRGWLAEGALRADSAPALYVYELAGRDGPRQRGLIGALGLRPESARVVLPHEDVYPGPVRDRLALMTATRANLEPILLIYEGGGAAAEAVDGTAENGAPVVEFRSADGLAHRLWQVTDPALHARIGADLRGRQALIADGHHRYATYRAMQAQHGAPGPWDYGLAMLVDSTRFPPHLGAIHRVLPGVAPRFAVERAREVFQVTPFERLDGALAALAGQPGPAFLVGGGEGLHLLAAPDEAALAAAMPGGHSDRWRRLDTAVLDELVIRRLWGVPEDERTVEVVHDDAAEAIERARRAGGTAVVLNPLRVADVLAVAAGGERVPRKSTSFGPKPRSGLVLRLLDLG